MVTWTNAELERRRPVWAALSDLFLDTETRWSLVDAAWAGLSAGFDWDELNAIYRREIAPVLWCNLLLVAGEWGCFDQAWLSQRIITRTARRGLLQKAWEWAVSHGDEQWLVVRQLYFALARDPSQRAALQALGHLYLEKRPEELLTFPTHREALAQYSVDELKRLFDEVFEPGFCTLLVPADPTRAEARQSWIRLLSSLEGHAQNQC